MCTNRKPDLQLFFLHTKESSMPIQLESPAQPEVIALIAALDAYQDSLYPAESRYALDLESLQQPNVRFAVARDAAGSAVGCCAIVLEDGFAELKRMYVKDSARGQGVAQKMVALLEQAALAAGVAALKLETGPFQPEALGFYAQQGFSRCGRYGDYRDDPLSVFMEKRLAA
jgi:putative acetyltransferase